MEVWNKFGHVFASYYNLVYQEDLQWKEISE